MKLILLIIGLATGICSAQFTNIFTGSAPNDGTGDTVRTAFGKANTNFYYLTNSIAVVSNANYVASNLLWTANAATSNSLPTAPTCSFTNWISGQLYTNNSSRLWGVHGMANLTPAAVLGTVGTFFQTATQGAALVTVGGHGFQTILTTLVMTNSIEMNGAVPPGYAFVFTNSISGAGNAAVLRPGSGYQLTF